MRAFRWRQKIIGDRDMLDRIRKIKIPSDVYSKYKEQINHDIHRSDIRKDKKDIENILNMYSFVNRGMGYSQGFNLLAVALWNVFNEDNHSNAKIDTFFALHGVIGLVRYLYPLNEKDNSPLVYAEFLSKMVQLQCSNIIFDRDMVQLLNAFIICRAPVLFCNMFDHKEYLKVWDFFLLHESDFQTKLIAFFSAIIQANKELFTSFSAMRIFEILAKRKYNIERLVLDAKRLSG